MKLFSRLLLRFSVMHLLLMVSAVLLMAATAANGAEPERRSMSLSTEGSLLSENQQKAELEITSFTVETQDTLVEIVSGLELSNNAGVKAQLRDGAVMTLSCRMSLEHVRTLLANELIAESVQEYHLRHDLLTREFVLSSAGTKPLRHKNFDTLLGQFRKLHFTLPLQEPLRVGETYRIRFELTLQHAEVPPWLSQALFFWSWDVVSPVSVTQDFLF